MNTIQSLKELYVKMGGSLTDTYSGIASGIPVSDYTVIPDCIKALYAIYNGDLSEIYPEISDTAVKDYSITPEALAALAKVASKGITPTGKITITENGENIDIAQYATADVAVETYSDEVKAMISGGQLQSIDIPNDVTQIRANAFNGVALHNVNFGDTHIIGERAFQSTYINTVDLSGFVPSGMGGVSIASNAFSDCTEITAVYLPVNVSAIQKNAFYGCTGITDVYYMGTQAQWEALISVSSGTIDATGNANLLNATMHYEYTPE